jgi:hypothetical protein
MEQAVFVCNIISTSLEIRHTVTWSISINICEEIYLVLGSLVSKVSILPKYQLRFIHCSSRIMHVVVMLTYKCIYCEQGLFYFSRPLGRADHWAIFSVTVHILNCHAPSCWQHLFAETATI